MKAQIRRWSNEEQKNYFVNVVIVDDSHGIAVKLDDIVITEGHTNVANALADAEKIIRDRKISNS